MDYRRRDRFLGAYGPLALMATLATWLTLALTGFTLIFWATEEAGWRAAFDLSGSSLFTLGFSRPGRARQHRADLPRGRDRPVPAGVARHVPPEHLRGVLPSRGGDHGPRGPRGLTTVGQGDDLALLAARAAPRDPRGLGRVGAVVRRRGGITHVAPVARLLPLVPPRSLVDHRRGCRARRRRDRPVVGGRPPRREGGVLHPGRVPVPARHRGLLPDRARPRSRAPTTRSPSAATSGRPSWRSWRKPACR